MPYLPNMASRSRPSFQPLMATHKIPGKTTICRPVIKNSLAKKSGRKLFLDKILPSAVTINSICSGTIILWSFRCSTSISLVLARARSISIFDLITGESDTRTEFLFKLLDTFIGTDVVRRYVEYSFKCMHSFVIFTELKHDHADTRYSAKMSRFKCQGFLDVLQ